jgi:hypothetical protein
MAGWRQSIFGSRGRLAHHASSASWRRAPRSVPPGLRFSVQPDCVLASTTPRSCVAKNCGPVWRTPRQPSDQHQSAPRHADDIHAYGRRPQALPGPVRLQVAPYALDTGTIADGDRAGGPPGELRNSVSATTSASASGWSPRRAHSNLLDTRSLGRSRTTMRRCSFPFLRDRVQQRRCRTVGGLRRTHVASGEAARARPAA